MYSQRRMRHTVPMAWTLTDDGEIPGKEKMMNEKKMQAARLRQYQMLIKFLNRQKQRSKD
jgi:hypothetical protein